MLSLVPPATPLTRQRSSAKLFQKTRLAKSASVTRQPIIEPSGDREKMAECADLRCLRLDLTFVSSLSHLTFDGSCYVSLVQPSEDGVATATVPSRFESSNLPIHPTSVHPDMLYGWLKRNAYVLFTRQDLSATTW